jgi:hypothetical protein
MTHDCARNRTNVRFLALLFGAGLSGCASTTAFQGMLSATCGRDLVVCERFGPEERCECIDRREVADWIGGYGGEPAWVGGGR